MDFLTEVVILMLAAWVGIEVISKVPQMLHTLQQPSPCPVAQLHGTAPPAPSPTAAAASRCCRRCSAAALMSRPTSRSIDG